MSTWSNLHVYVYLQFPLIQKFLDNGNLECLSIEELDSLPSKLFSSSLKGPEIGHRLYSPNAHKYIELEVRFLEKE